MINDKKDYRFIDKGSNKTIKSIKALKKKNIGINMDYLS